MNRKELQDVSAGLTNEKIIAAIEPLKLFQVRFGEKKTTFRLCMFRKRKEELYFSGSLYGSSALISFTVEKERIG